MVKVGSLIVENFVRERRITIDRPTKCNALDPDLLRGLSATIDQASADDSVRIISLQGTGTCFCAGADLDWMLAGPTKSFEQSKQDLEPLFHMYRALEESRWPIAAVVHGDVTGGGVGITAACDFVFAVENSCFSLPEASLGLIPGLATAPIVRRIGAMRFLEMALGGRKIGTEEAKHWGLITENGTDSASWLAALGSHLGALAPGSIREIRSVARALPEARSLERLLESVASRRISAEAGKGASERRKKHNPAW